MAFASPTLCEPAAPDARDAVWSFGFGSNMNVEFVRHKKGYTVLDHAPAVVKGYRMAFATGGFECVEPSFATTFRGGADDEIHGVALLLPLADAAALDAQEGSYARAQVAMTTYDGRTLDGFLYTAKAANAAAQAARAEVPCSQRYLNILVNGARDAGLDPAYVERLAAKPYYVPSAETIAARRALPPPDALPAWTVDQLHATKEDSDGDAHVSILGYVLALPRTRFFMRRHEGRDLTARQSRQWNGVSMDADDDGGKMPMVKAVADFPPAQLEFVWQWLDHYLARGATPVGYLAEFKRQNPGVHPM